MMIFPKKLPRDRAPQEAAPVESPPPAAEDHGRMPETWRVVLEDGSTSGDLPEAPRCGAGQKLMAEVTAAVSGRADRKRRQGSARSVAMPPSTRQSLHALDSTLIPKTGRLAKSSPSPTRPSPTIQPAPIIQPSRSAPKKGPDGKPPGAPLAAVETADLLGGRTSAPRRELDARLARVIDAWPRLSRGIQAAIIALVDADA